MKVVNEIKSGNGGVKPKAGCVLKWMGKHSWTVAANL